MKSGKKTPTEGNLFHRHLIPAVNIREAVPAVTMGA